MLMRLGLILEHIKSLAKCRNGLHIETLGVIGSNPIVGTIRPRNSAR